MDIEARSGLRTTTMTTRKTLCMKTMVTKMILCMRTMVTRMNLCCCRRSTRTMSTWKSMMTYRYCHRVGSTKRLLHASPAAQRESIAFLFKNKNQNNRKSKNKKPLFYFPTHFRFFPLISIIVFFNNFE